MTLRYKDDGKEDGEKGESDSGTAANSKADIVSVDRAVIFKNGKSVAKLASDETQGLIYTLPESKRGSFSVDGFSVNEHSFGAVYGTVARKKVKIKTFFKHGKPVIRYEIDIKASVSAKQEFLYLIDENVAGKSEIYAAIADALQEKTAAQIKAAADVSRYLDADYMNVKYRFYRLNSRQIKVYEADENNDFLRDLTTEVAVRVKIS